MKIKFNVFLESSLFAKIKEGLNTKKGRESTSLIISIHQYRTSEIPLQLKKKLERSNKKARGRRKKKKNHLSLSFS